MSIARSLLKKSSVLLADEATAALDAETAHQVACDILDLDGVTRIVVTHALEEAQLRRYDGIIVLKNGRIAEQGSSDALMAQKGYFYALFTVAQSTILNHDTARRWRAFAYLVDEQPLVSYNCVAARRMLFRPHGKE